MTIQNQGKKDSKLSDHAPRREALFTAIKMAALEAHRKNPFFVETLGEWFPNSMLTGGIYSRPGSLNSLHAHRDACLELYRVISTKIASTAQKESATSIVATPHVIHAFSDAMPPAMLHAPFFDNELFVELRSSERRGETHHVIEFAKTEPRSAEFFRAYSSVLGDLQYDTNLDIMRTTMSYSVTMPAHAIIIPATHAVGTILASMSQIVDSLGKTDWSAEV